MVLGSIVRRVLDQIRKTTEPAQPRTGPAAVDGHPLPLGEVGAVITLARSSQVDWTETLPSGCVASVFANSRVILITGLDATEMQSGSARVARAEANVLLD